MQIGLIGLGKMGFNLALNLSNHKHEVIAHDVFEESTRKIAENEGISPAFSLTELAGKFSGKKVIWLMVPSGETVDKVIEQLVPLLAEGDVIIDGGNSFFKDSVKRYEYLKNLKINFLDCGTSGGTSGALQGACTMIGGEKAVFESCEPIFKDICVENGYLYCGNAGSGHFTKMVHNGIEYGMMQSIAEGFEVLNKSEYNFDFEAIAKVWNHGSVVRSWLMKLAESAFSKDANLSGIKGIMHSSGEGKWTLETALNMGVATPVIALSLLMRYRSQEDDTFAGKIVAALRNEFGGHKVEKAE
jgi:6-phosphogluconate dehydrogenase